MKLNKHNGVLCAGCTISLLGTTLKTFVYLVDGLAVDTGPSKFRKDYLNFFNSHRPERVVLTHFHEDHSGNAPFLEKNGVEIYSHPSAISLCRVNAKIPFYRRIFWGSRSKFSPRPVGSEIEGLTRTFQIIEVPGHSFDHIAIYDPGEGVFFTGDLFVTPKTKIVMKCENIYRIMDSLKKILNYDFRAVYCAHAGVVDNGREMIKKKTEYLENLVGEVFLLKEKGMGVAEINKKIFPKTAPLTLISGKEWSSEHIIRSIISDKG
ncbi:MBL fold metallo-hydrolase [Desulfotruncus arcticus]|uniref:MBL fold metallo-hydrolase n=1 Tax=Desulfotruncus arcticus TaxID=341036 RepID=UPI0013F4E6EF|nr:MBL fold metallo-hydrolase [Desulfotruncus arcticus]